MTENDIYRAFSEIIWDADEWLLEEDKAGAGYGYVYGARDMMSIMIEQIRKEEKEREAKKPADVHKTDVHKADVGKPPLSLVPTGILWEIARVRDYGVNVKYPETGLDGWRNIGKQRIRDAMLRHCLRYIEDPDGADKESGLSHLSHLACNVAFLIELEGRNNEKD